MKHKCKPGSPASILMGHSHEHHHDHHEHRKHHADGGEAMPNMPIISARREEPNMHNRFKRGGRAMGGEMQMEDHLKAEGTYGSRGSEMDKENHKRACGGGLKRKRHAEGGEIGVNTGSSIARKPGDDAIGHKKGGRALHRAMGGVGKERKGYPNT